MIKRFMAHGLNRGASFVLFRDFLQALRDFGDVEAADEAEKANIAKFKGTLTVEQLMNMDMHTINGVLNMEKYLKQLVTQQQKHDESPLKAYVNSLYARGFSNVAVNPQYQPLLDTSHLSAVSE
jgi:hypothetical protein